MLSCCYSSCSRIEKKASCINPSPIFLIQTAWVNEVTHIKFCVRKNLIHKIPRNNLVVIFTESLVHV